MGNHPAFFLMASQYEKSLPLYGVIPAQAGIHHLKMQKNKQQEMDSGVRRNDA